MTQTPLERCVEIRRMLDDRKFTGILDPVKVSEILALYDKLTEANKALFIGALAEAEEKLARGDSQGARSALRPDAWLGGAK